MSPAIKVSNVQKIYRLYSSPKDRVKEIFSLTKKKLHKDFFALDDINFELQKGDTLGVIGKNGSGKSTLLKIIAGIIQPTKGQVKLTGKVSALIELGAGFNPDYTGIENVYFYGMILGFTQEEMQQKLDDIISFAEIGEFLYQPIKTYSSGMKSRLAFSVAINTDPEILIVDEVLSVGDMFFKQKCINKLRAMLDEGLTLFFVSHSLGDIKSLCNKALYIKNGKQLAFGDAESVCNMYQNESTQKIESDIYHQNLNKNITVVNIIDDKRKYFRYDYHLDSKILNRSGSQDITVVSFDIYNSKQDLVSAVESFEKITIRISLKVNKDIPKGASIGVLCRDNKGNDIFSINSDVYGLYLPSLFKSDKYTYEIELSLPLVESSYSFSMGIKPSPDSDIFYDRCFNLCAIKVNKPKNQKTTGGILYFFPDKMGLRYE